MMRPRQWGVTLVELLVSMAIGLVVALASTMAYLAVRNTANATDAMSRMNEDGKLALDMLSREIQMAGFYPAAMTSPATPNLRGAFTNIKNAAAPAYNQGIFGCSGGKFLPATAACETPVADAPDSIVLNYFSASGVTDLGTGNISVSRDCINGNLNLDPVNAALAAGQPMFVSSRFAINSTSYSQASAGGGGNASSKDITTGSLSCNGNGINPDGNTYQPVFEGVSQMVIRYAVHDGVLGETPRRFYTATEVNALPVVNDLNPWQRVAAVRVCLLMESLTGGRNDTAAGVSKTYLDCNGDTVTQPATDRRLLKALTRVIAVRNQLTGVQ